jgi:hypothetical protein
MATITSANSKMTLAVPPVVGVSTVQGYATDDAFATETVESAVAVMGVDGRMSHGYTPFITKLRVMLQADSPSISIFETWLSANTAVKDSLEGQMNILLPSVKKTYAFFKCALTRITPLPPAKKTLEPVEYEVSSEGFQVLPTG